MVLQSKTTRRLSLGLTKSWRSPVCLAEGVRRERLGQAQNHGEGGALPRERKVLSVSDATNHLRVRFEKALGVFVVVCPACGVTLAVPPGVIAMGEMLHEADCAFMAAREGEEGGKWRT